VRGKQPNKISNMMNPILKISHLEFREGFFYFIKIYGAVYGMLKLKKY